jgi:hypothetical protein
MIVNTNSHQNKGSLLESYHDDIRRSASSVVKVKSSSRDNSIDDLANSIIESSDEMNCYVLNRNSRETAKSSVKYPSIARILRALS